jgi:hypothetical protein
VLTDKATQVTVDYFLAKVRERNPAVIPQYFMSDRDQAQMNAIRERVPEAKLLLCWWHVLHAWRRHLKTEEHPILWDELKRWIRVREQDKFNKCWEKIKDLSPSADFTKYLESEWMGNAELWSAVHRQGRDIYQESDTNMLVEA